jgi:hypothetical protein
VCADKFLCFYQVLGIMHEHFGHELTHRIRREELAALFVMEFASVVQLRCVEFGMVSQSGAQICILGSLIGR